MFSANNELKVKTVFETVRRRYQRSRGLRWLVDGVAIFIVILGVSAWQTRAHLAGVPIPKMPLTDMSGQVVFLESLRGKPSIVSIWAPWCGVCGAQSQNVSWVTRLVEERANVTSVVASYRSVAEATQFMKDHDVDYPVLLAPDGWAESMNVRVFPTIYFIDADGTIKRSVTGYTTTLGLLWRLFLP